MSSVAREPTVPDATARAPPPVKVTANLIWQVAAGFFCQSFSKLWHTATDSEDQLTADESASTQYRFFRSDHVIDLRWIAGLAILLLFIHLLVVAALTLVRPFIHLISNYILPHLGHLIVRLTVLIDHLARGLFALIPKHLNVTFSSGHVAHSFARGIETLGEFYVHGLVVLGTLFGHGLGIAAEMLVESECGAVAVG